MDIVITIVGSSLVGSTFSAAIIILGWKRAKRNNTRIVVEQVRKAFPAPYGDMLAREIEEKVA